MVLVRWKGPPAKSLLVITNKCIYIVGLLDARVVRLPLHSIALPTPSAGLLESSRRPPLDYGTSGQGARAPHAQAVLSLSIPVGAFLKPKFTMCPVVFDFKEPADRWRDGATERRHPDPRSPVGGTREKPSSPKVYILFVRRDHRVLHKPLSQR